MTPVFSDVFTEMAVLLMVAAVIGAIGVRLRQPLIVAFIAVGILVGPAVLGWVSANDQVDFARPSSPLVVAAALNAQQPAQHGHE
jgi:predicted Kef-type K+ transport protein